MTENGSYGAANVPHGEHLHEASADCPGCQAEAAQGVAKMLATPQRKSALTTVQQYRLNEACRLIRRAFDGNGPYLVGSVLDGDKHRDVDVRTILPDEEWDDLFAGRERLWDLFCLSVSHYLTAVTTLPVDYQVQRMTEANAKFHGPRHALGMSAEPASRFAGGGDATPTASAREGA